MRKFAVRNSFSFICFFVRNCLYKKILGESKLIGGFILGCGVTAFVILTYPLVPDLVMQFIQGVI